MGGGRAPRWESRKLARGRTDYGVPSFLCGLDLAVFAFYGFVGGGVF